MFIFSKATINFRIKLALLLSGVVFFCKISSAQVAVGKEMKTIKSEFEKQKDAELQPSSNKNYLSYKFNSNFILAVTCQGNKKGICTKQTVYLLPKFSSMVRQMMLSFGRKVNDSLYVKADKEVKYSMQFQEGEKLLVCLISLLSDKEYDAFLKPKN